MTTTTTTKTSKKKLKPNHHRVVCFRDVIIERMAEFDMTQTKLSELTGILQPNLSNYLNEKRGMSELNLEVVLGALGVGLCLTRWYNTSGPGQE